MPTAPSRPSPHAVARPHPPASPSGTARTSPQDRGDLILCPGGVLAAARCASATAPAVRLSGLPPHLSSRVHAVVLAGAALRPRRRRSGGGAPGAKRYGFQTASGGPRVPTAILFDLAFAAPPAPVGGVGPLWRPPPLEEVAVGSVGAGTGATVARPWAGARHEGGFGFASLPFQADRRRRGGAVNAFGDVRDVREGPPAGSSPAAARPDRLDLVARPGARRPAAREPHPWRGTPPSRW